MIIERRQTFSFFRKESNDNLVATVIISDRQPRVFDSIRRGSRNGTERNAFALQKYARAEGVFSADETVTNSDTTAGNVETGRPPSY